MIDWSTAAPAASAAFLASTVEAVEAFTIVLAVKILRGWRPAAAGVLVALAVLIVIVIAAGPLLNRVPLHALQLIIGILLLLFGMGWLRKAALRASGILPKHDEDAVFTRASQQYESDTAQANTSLDWVAGITAFKAVLLEGLEIVFIVIAIGTRPGLLLPASLGALAACAIVLIVGMVVHQPLSRVPENTLKFAVGVVISAFGVFWTGEGLGVDWPGHDVMIPVIALLFLATALLTVAWIRRASVVSVK